MLLTPQPSAAFMNKRYFEALGAGGDRQLTVHGSAAWAIKIHGNNGCWQSLPACLVVTRLIKTIHHIGCSSIISANNILAGLSCQRHLSRIKDDDHQWVVA